MEASDKKGILFEYLGHTGLTVLGPATGTRYRVGWHGAVVAVKREDFRAVLAVPNLRRVT